MEKGCKGYVGVACINGTCPKTIKEEYEEQSRSIIHCGQCFLTWDVRIVLWLAQSIVKLKTRRKTDEIL